MRSEHKRYEHQILEILEGEKEMAKAKAKFKLKTKRSAAKRLKVSGTGKVMRRKGWKGHLLSGKNSSRKRRLTGSFEVTKDSKENVKQMLPYGSK